MSIKIFFDLGENNFGLLPIKGLSCDPNIINKSAFCMLKLPCLVAYTPKLPTLFILSFKQIECCPVGAKGIFVFFNNFSYLLKN